ncbi:hypothetical protein C8R47DRAFT_1216852 [Mycena vitilis]|nr:hypothetical protein C8R47DRAFT_1216852 [Mycena vitilis]
MHRGRPRTPKARQESIDRAFRSQSTSPPSSASLSPRSRSPTPPLSLSDRVHIAYADDDIHLAKVLLLRLQGIEVTSDADPRIAAVRDEDFDACFIPFGRLDDGRGEPAPSTPPPEEAPDALRLDSLKAKERLWDAEARRFTEERCRYAALKRRQSDTLRVAAAEQERVRLIKQKEAAAAVVDLRRRRADTTQQMKPTARTLNFALVPPVPKPPQKFTYDFPFTPRHLTTPTSNTTTTPHRPAPTPVPARRSPQPTDVRDDPPREPTRVTFQQVLASIHGDLFPPLPHERPPLLRLDRRQRALVDALLASDFDFDVKGKGKGRAIPQPCCSPLSTLAPAPASPSPSTSTPSSASSGLSRAGSWLSFGGSSSSSSSSTSTSTTGTSASSSSSAGSSSWSASDLPASKLPLRLATWLPGTRRTASPEPASASSSGLSDSHSDKSQHTPQCRLRCFDAPRAAADVHPLLPSVYSHSSQSNRSYASSSSFASASSSSSPHSQRTRDSTDSHEPHKGHLPFTLSLARLAALARNLQTAYVRAVVVGYGTGGYEDDDFYNDHDEGREGERLVEDTGYRERETYEKAPRLKEPSQRVPLASQLRLKPVGARAGRGDVRVFLASPSSSSPASSCVDSASSSSGLESASSATESPRLAPHASLSALSRFSSPYSTSYQNHNGKGPRTQLPSRLPYARVFAPPPPLPRSPWAPGARVASSSSLPSSLPSLPVSHSQSASHADADRGDGGDADPAAHWEAGGDKWTPPALRARAVPNSAFLRVKALHHDALPLLASSSGASYQPHPQSFNVNVNVNANAHAQANANANAAHATVRSSHVGLMEQQTRAVQPRRPRECVVGLGVDYVPGSGLRFVYAEV